MPKNVENVKCPRCKGTGFYSRGLCFRCQGRCVEAKDAFYRAVGRGKKYFGISAPMFGLVSKELTSADSIEEVMADMIGPATTTVTEITEEQARAFFKKHGTSVRVPAKAG